MFCSVEGCERKAYAKGLCETHYRRMRRNGHAGRVRPEAIDVCTVEGCAKPHDALGLCHGHYQRMQRHGDIGREEPLDRNKNMDACIVDGCDRPQRTRKMCTAHYSRWLRLGDTLASTPIKRRTGEGSISHGYRKVKVPDEMRHLTNGETYVVEHRLVMAQMLGRPLFPDESVHHKNGNRLFNDPSNLELWSRWQPSGQRIEDQISWAIAFLERYAKDKLAPS